METPTLPTFMQIFELEGLNVFKGKERKKNGEACEHQDMWLDRGETKPPAMS